MSGPAFWPGDRMMGTNRYTRDFLAGKLVRLETSDLDGKVYAILDTGQGEAVILAADLNGPRACRRPTANEPWNGKCARCGRDIYPNGPYDTDHYTHHLNRVHSRYR